MNWFERMKTRSAIKKFTKKLGPMLKKRYGHSKTYTGQQVNKTVEQSGLSPDYICYAYAIFMERDAFDLLHRELGQSCDYQAMRQEVADVCFAGDASFTTADVVSQGESSGSIFSALDAAFFGSSGPD